MPFDSVSDFFAMGGDGLFVWGAYAISAVLITVSSVSAARAPGLARRDIAGALRREQRRERAQPSSSGVHSP